MAARSLYTIAGALKLWYYHKDYGKTKIKKNNHQKFS